MHRAMSLRSRLIDTSPRSWLVDIDDYFLQSSVSYYDLNKKVSHCSRAAEIIKGGSADNTAFTRAQMERLGTSVRRLYGLLHQRFVITEDGVQKVAAKVANAVYGLCPRVACQQSKLIPVGSTIEPDEDVVKLWCPKCHDIYESGSDLDAAFFGPDLPVMYHKVLAMRLKFQVASDYLDAYEKPDGEVVPGILQRLVRWGE
jgi:casein kinase II subunit beta